jgi:PmbA protein
MTEYKARQAAAQTILDDLLKAARAAGADAADALMVEGRSLSVSTRLGKPEDVERSEGRDVGLRVFVGQSGGSMGQACVSTADVAKAGLAELVARCVAMARAAPPDPFIGLAPAERLARGLPELDLADTMQFDVARLTEFAKATEDAALAVAGVTNSEGAGASHGDRVVALATTGGFAGAYATSSYSLSASVVAGTGTDMQADGDYASTHHFADLRQPAEIGRTAGEKAVKRLHPRKMPSGPVPVIFSPEAARSLLGHLAGAITGTAIARGVSFLKDKLGEPVFAPGIRIVDDPLRLRGLRSRPFDAEGVAGGPMALVEDGRLTTWLMDCASARQLGLATTGHAQRDTGSPPHPGTTNLYLEPGSATPDELMSDIAAGIYVTDLIGFGVNGVTGDYSRGAAGFWIENGKPSFPVAEMTIAGNLKAMFQRLVPANDLIFRFGTDAPTVRIDGMTVAGL